MIIVFKFILGFAAGLLVGVVGGFVQAGRITIGGQLVPYGFVITCALLVVTLLWVGRALQSRIAVISAALGWALVTVVLAGLLGEQIAVITSAWYSKVYVFGGAVISGIISAFPVLKPVPERNSLEESFTDVMQDQFHE